MKSFTQAFHSRDVAGSNGSMLSSSKIWRRDDKNSLWSGHVMSLLRGTNMRHELAKRIHEPRISTRFH